MTKKDLISTIYITILTLAALVYGFTSIPSPAQQRQLVLDHQRVSDIGRLKQSIEDYFAMHKQLPKSLEDVRIDTSNSTEPISIVDQETKKPYEYKILNETPPYIQLCATFTTDSHKEDPNEQDNSVSYWATYSGNYQHPAGHYCFKENIGYYAPTPSVAPVTGKPTK